MPVETGAAARAGAAARGADDRERAGCPNEQTEKINPSKITWVPKDFMTDPLRRIPLAVVYAWRALTSIADFGQEWPKSTTFSACRPRTRRTPASPVSPRAEPR